jgi:hypothetical protein
VPMRRVTVGTPLRKIGVGGATLPARGGSPVAPGLGEDSGPHPAARAAAGLLLGLGVGLASALFIPGRQKSASAATTTDSSPGSAVP